MAKEPKPPEQEDDELCESELGERLDAIETRLDELESDAREVFRNLPKFAMMGLPKRLKQKYQQ